jgi:predicted alpha-1,2-mannosidase
MEIKAETLRKDSGLRKLAKKTFCVTARRLGQRIGVIITVYLVVGAVLPCMAGERASDPFRMVDPRIGTAHDGQTYPVVGVPFGMTGWTPETRSTEAKCVAPYYYNDPKISGFRSSHWLSGSCTQDYGSVTVMPTVGELKVTPDERASRFQHASEVMSPAYYSVHLDDYNVKVELAGTTRSGMMRITFPASGRRNLFIEPNVRPGKGFIEVRPSSGEIVGYNPVVRIYQGAGQSAGFNGYFVIRLEQPIKDFGTWCGTETTKQAQQQGSGCDRLGAYITLANNTPQHVLVRIGTSFTSIDEAERNLSTEEPDWNFDTVRAHTEDIWRQYLSRIEIEGGTPVQRTIFYTALFHASLAPRIVSDADGSCNGFANEGRLHHAPPGTDYYDDFSLWDIRCARPSHTRSRCSG